MTRLPKKSVRKLVTLPPDLAERVDNYRQKFAPASESDALKSLIEDGLKMRDTPEDLFQRCETSTSSGQSIKDVIYLTTSNHPLVDRTIIDQDAVLIMLKTPPDARLERFRYARARGTWAWEYRRGEYEDDWVAKESSTQSAPKKSVAGELDDDIPF